MDERSTAGLFRGHAVDAAGNVYVTGRDSDNAFKITPAGIIQIIDMTGDGVGNGLAQPMGIAVDAAGNVYVVGFASDNAFKITPGDPIPAVSGLGMVALLLLTAVAGVIFIRHRLRAC